MQTMLEHLDLLADRLVLLLRRIVAAHVAALREDAFAHGARAHVELVRLLLLELDGARDRVRLVLHPRHLDRSR